ncbi:hypothetical protein EJB05_27249, partial [Eragrostis curvula]
MATPGTRATRRRVAAAQSSAAPPSSGVSTAPSPDVTAPTPGVVAHPASETEPTTQDTTGTADPDVVEIDDSVDAGNKRKLRSAVWSDFKQITVHGKLRAECNWCHKTFVAGARAVDHVGFRKFCAALQPLFKVVSRNTIKKDILDMFIYVPSPHTAEVISDVLHDVLVDWQIEKKNIHGLMAVATVLDPRFKLQFLSAFYTHIYGTDGKAAEINKVKELLYELVSEYQSSLEGAVTTDSIGATSRNAVQTEGDDMIFNIFDGYMSCSDGLKSTVAADLVTRR